MTIRLSDHFTVRRLLRFTLPSIFMMIVTSIYGVVDGFFVSNFVGKTPFAAVNFIMPVLMILNALGFMMGAGGGALIARTLGEGDAPRANRYFSLFIYLSLAAGAVLAVAGFVLVRPLAVLMGARGELLENCVLYARVILPALPLAMLQMEFQSLFVTAEKPNLGLWITVASGVSNMVLDAVLVAGLGLGLVGAAAATAFSQFVGGCVPLFYFARPNKSLLRLGRTRFDGRALLKACSNGSSELMSNVSMSLVAILYNTQLMRYAGEDGVAAYGVLMYVSMIFSAAFFGYAVGTAPVISFHYGAGHRDELHSLLLKSFGVIGVFSVCMTVSSELLGAPLSQLFVGYDAGLYALTCRAFGFYSFSFLFSGFAIFASSFFTALNDGLTSALISFLRTLVLQVAAVLILPVLFGVDGIWLSIVAADLLAVVVSLIFLAIKQKKYRY